MDKEIGTITHWYDQISVGVIKLTGSLSLGDSIKVVKGDTEFEDTVSSLQLDHKDVDKAKKGDDVAVKLSKKPRDGAKVYLVSA